MIRSTLGIITCTCDERGELLGDDFESVEEVNESAANARWLRSSEDDVMTHYCEDCAQDHGHDDDDDEE